MNARDAKLVGISVKISIFGRTSGAKSKRLLQKHHLSQISFIRIVLIVSW